jgi:DNA-3-methyladenine glycosylase
MKIEQSFFTNDVLDIAPLLPGKKIIRVNGSEKKEYIITEVEAYRGEEDLACHASKGRTRRTEIMYHEGGHIYMYLIYGMYWMLNIVTGPKDNPQAVLIRGIEDYNGPGRVSRELDLNGSFYGEKIFDSERIWLEEGIEYPVVNTAARIGVDYAGYYWSMVPWRYFIST